MTNIFYKIKKVIFTFLLMLLSIPALLIFILLFPILVLIDNNSI